ncbi:MAG TPA: hypothetical protein VKZ63_11675 [Kofleriaceae bacterium]|nr:hypothetical protein [Kofleriaceae bacterium]
MRLDTTAAQSGSALRLALSASLIAAILIALAPTAGAQPPPAAAGGGDQESETAPASGQEGSAPAESGAAPAGGDASAAPAAGGDASAAPVAATSEDVPVNIRLRQLEQRVQALKERAWRAKARVEMLKEAVLGGGIGARAGITHVNKMGSSYRLIQLVYALDGTTIFSRKDDSGGLHDTKSFEVLSGPITPGSHTLSVMAVYRGHGYGVFKYLKKYKFTVRSSHTFTVDEGKGMSIRVVGFEKGGSTTPLEDRPALDFQVSVTKE